MPRMVPTYLLRERSWSLFILLLNMLLTKWSLEKQECMAGTVTLLCIVERLMQNCHTQLSNSRKTVVWPNVITVAYVH